LDGDGDAFLIRLALLKKLSAFLRFSARFSFPLLLLLFNPYHPHHPHFDKK
jgi:hypothetical protein